MKKSIVICSLALLGGSSLAMANDAMKDWFIGGEFGGMGIKHKLTITGSGTVGGTPFSGSVSASERANTTFESIKVGKYFDHGRAHGSLGIQNKKDGFSSYGFGIGYDYLFKTSTKVTPFLGASLGYTKAKIDIEEYKLLNINKPSGFTYGVGGGVLYPISSNLDLEMGVRYVATSIKDDVSGTYNDGADTITGKIKIEAKDYTQYYIGLNYRF